MFVLSLFSLFSFKRRAQGECVDDKRLSKCLLYLQKETKLTVWELNYRERVTPQVAIGIVSGLNLF